MRYVGLLVAAVATMTSLASTGLGQVPTTPVVSGGVMLDASGTVKMKASEPAQDLPRDMKTPGLTYVSLPRAIEKLREATAAKKDVGDEVRYLAGLTQIRYVFIYPEQKDIVIAGPADTFDAKKNKYMPIGKTTGRPVLQLDDVIIALRVANKGGASYFGCSLDTAPDSQKRSDEVAAKFGAGSRAKLVEEMKKAIGPQDVRIFGVPEDSRVAFSVVAADYRMKRLSMGLETFAVAGVTHAVDGGKPTTARFWFETMYEPLKVSDDGLAYEFSGQRLQVKAGAQNFATDSKGVTEPALKFAENFTKKMPEIVQRHPIFADLQNLADVGLLATLVKEDKLAQKAGWDTTWVMDESAYKPEALPVAKKAETQVSIMNGAIASGGVQLSYGTAMKQRETKPAAEVAAVKQRPETTWFVTPTK